MENRLGPLSTADPSQAGWSGEIPILLLVFNRPEPTARVFERIRQMRPARLYVAADGPRADRKGEAETVAEVRRIATAADWPCEVRTLFRDENLGCRRAVSSGIDWFFEAEEMGIVLEDDVLPDPSFFPYCEVLLRRYAGEPAIGIINGTNVYADILPLDAASYEFIRHSHVWGWASWRRFWQTYSVDMDGWAPGASNAHLRRYAAPYEARRHWDEIFGRCARNEVGTWDYQVNYACWRQGLLNISPAHNLIENIGFGADATHTSGGVPEDLLANPARPLAFPLRHPAAIVQNRAADRVLDRRHTGLSKAKIVREAIKRPERALRAWVKGFGRR